MILLGSNKIRRYGECYSGKKLCSTFYLRSKKWKEAVGVIKKMLRDLCGNRIVVSAEQNIKELQHRHLLVGGVRKKSEISGRNCAIDVLRLMQRRLPQPILQRNKSLAFLDT